MGLVRREIEDKIKKFIERREIIAIRGLDKREKQLCLK